MENYYKINFFLRFLKENDALIEYEKYFHRLHKECFFKPIKEEETLMEFIENTDCFRLLEYAYNWDETHNYEYWYKLNNDWYWFMILSKIRI